MSGVTALCRSREAQPTTAFRGVRSSWDTIDRKSSLRRFAVSASARARCADSYNRARSSACAQWSATEISNARYSASKFTGTLKWNSNVPIGVPSTSNGNTADDRYAASAACEADRQYCSCDSAHDATNTGSLVSTTSVTQRPFSAANVVASLEAASDGARLSVSNLVPLSTRIDTAPV